MPLSHDAALMYVLHNGVAGRLTSGRIVRENTSLAVYTGPSLTLNEYISGPQIRSWCVVGPTGNPWRNGVTSLRKIATSFPACSGGPELRAY